MGSTSAIDIDRRATSGWPTAAVPTRCAGSDSHRFMKFDASGKLLTSFGAGCLSFRMASRSTATATSG